MRVIQEIGSYRIVELADDSFGIECLKGESFDPEANPDIPADQLAREERDFEDLVSREGVFGYVLERWNPEIGSGWEHVDSCWGFVGQFTPSEDTFNHYIVRDMIDTARAGVSA